MTGGARVSPGRSADSKKCLEPAIAEIYCLLMLTLIPLDVRGADREALVDFMTATAWPHHVEPRPSRERIEQNIDDGVYDDEDHEAFWLHDEDRGRVGYARLEDLTDGAPLFDLRLAPDARGKGLATQAVVALTHDVFTRFPEVTRFEGQTRDDNIPMRRAFLRAGWVKEAHYREAWPVKDGPARASVAYAILRRDWESGVTTPVVWDDLPV